LLQLVVICCSLILSGAALLEGCAGPQSTGVSPPQSAVPAQAHKASGSDGDLLYALSLASKRGDLRAYTFPGGVPVSRQTVQATGGLCSDANGNIFIPKAQAIDEYAHGGRRPTATLNDTGYYARNCSVDPNSGNLAVTNVQQDKSVSGNVVVYRDAQGSPTAYTDSQMYYYISCAYDNSGDLFVVGASQTNAEMLAELPKGGSTFTNITLDKGVYYGSIQWDGEYLAMQGAHLGEIYRVEVSGSSGTVAQIVGLKGSGRGKFRYFWIQGNIAAATGWNGGLWNYPEGGKPIRYFSKRGHVGVHFAGVTVSVAPSHK
jgi:hypothetical protein